MQNTPPQNSKTLTSVQIWAYPEHPPPVAVEVYGDCIPKGYHLGLFVSHVDHSLFCVTDYSIILIQTIVSISLFRENRDLYIIFYSL